jgi:NTP pyrophosphatase (non-canonical NTP hydrolase)
MDIDKYQDQTKKTNLFLLSDDPPAFEIQLSYYTLGLTGEAGEVANKVKKYLREDYGFAQLRAELLDEVGDVLWYLSELCSSVGLSLNEIADLNLVKLSRRLARGKIKGSGDNR